MLHVHLAPLAPVGSRRFPFVRAGHAAAGTSAARAVVPVRMRGGGARRGGGDVGEHRRRRGIGHRRRDAQRREKRLAHGHRGQGDRTDRHRDGSRGAVQRARGRRERRVQHAPPLVQRARQVGVHLLDRRQQYLRTIIITIIIASHQRRCDYILLFGFSY